MIINDNINKISVHKIEELEIPLNKKVNVYFSHNYMLVTDKLYNQKIEYVKKSKCEYMNTRTGELKMIDMKNNNKSIASMRKSVFRMALIINSNFVGGKSEQFITLSYNHKVTESSTVNRDLKNFCSKLKRLIKVEKLFRCIIITEFQNGGNLHFHLLAKRLDGQELSLSKAVVEKLWGKGLVDVQRIYDVHGLSNYLNPFNIETKKKRIGFYKKGMRLFRCHGQFEKPLKRTLTYEEILNLAKFHNLKEFSRVTYEIIENKTNTIVNEIKKIKFIKEKKYDN